MSDGPSVMSAFVLLLSDEPTSGATTKRLIYEYSPLDRFLLLS